MNRKRQEPVGKSIGYSGHTKKIKIFDYTPFMSNNFDTNSQRYSWSCTPTHIEPSVQKYSQQDVDQIHSHYRELLNKKEIELSNVLSQLIDFKKEYIRQCMFTGDCSYIT